MIPGACIDEFNQWFKRIYCWVSGGKDSTALALSLYDQQDQIEGEIILIHINTGLRMQSSNETLQKLKKQTKFPLIELKPSLPSLPNILKESFRAIPDAEKAYKEGKYDRRIFSCCTELKHKPGREFIKSIPKRERERYVFLSAITPRESRRRGWFLNDLKTKNLYHIWNTKMHAFYAYPFRDLYSTQSTEKFLWDHDFRHTQKSGCVICPILLLFNLEYKEPIRWIRSKEFLLKHVKNVEFCQKSTPSFREVP